MKAKVYFFRVTIALVTLTLGVGVYLVWQFLSVKTTSEIARIEQPAIEIIKPESFAEFTKEVNKSSKEDELVKEKFEPDGGYYLIGSSPRAFRDFDSVSVLTNDNKLRKDGKYGNPIPPTGHIYTKIKHKFTQVNINNRQITFETESKNGVSYKFVGFFPKEYEDKDLNDWVSLEGDLIKLKDGKKVAEMKAKFGYIGGC